MNLCSENLELHDFLRICGCENLYTDFFWSQKTCISRPYCIAIPVSHKNSSHIIQIQCSVVFETLCFATLPSLHRSKVRAKNGQSICHGEGYTIGCLGAWPAFTYRLAA